MQIMLEKELVVRNTESRTHIYDAAVFEADVQNQLLRKFVQTAYRGSASRLVMQLLGNHSASAVTNYFDSLDDISDLNLDEINEMAESITTVDLQYGYNVKTGKRDRGVISFSLGIRNIFDKKTTQILNHNNRVVDQNGRVAYGSIKYQF